MEVNSVSGGRQHQYTCLGRFLPSCSNTLSFSQAALNYYPYCLSTLSRMLLRLCKTTILKTAVYSCFDKGCPTKFKHTPQCRLTVIVYRYLIQAYKASARRKGKHEYTCLCCFLLSCRNTLQLQSGHSKPPVPIIPFDIVAYAYTLLWDNLSQNSCRREYGFSNSSLSTRMHQSEMRHFLPKCIALRTTRGCHTSFSRGI